MLALAGIATLPASAQSIAAPDAATLAKYDKNHNGVLDPDEVAAMQADQAKAAAAPVATSATATDKDVIALSPYEVDATKETGY